MTPSLSSLFWFLAVLAAIPVALWLLRQSPLGRLHGLQGQDGAVPLRQLSSLALSPSQRVVAVEVGQGPTRQVLVLGVTPSSIATLHTMPPAGSPNVGFESTALQHLPSPPDAQAPTAAPLTGAASTFAALLDRLRPTDRSGVAR